MDRPDHELEAARREIGLTTEDLWLRYFALGGAALPIEFEGFLAGALKPDRYDRDIVVHALNERSMELGLSRRWPYSDDQP